MNKSTVFWLIVILLAAGWLFSLIYSTRLAVDGVMYSSILALAAVGLTMTYITTKVPNFAHGAIMGVGTLTALALSQKFGISPYVAGLIALPFSIAISVVLYYTLMPIYKRGASPTILMMASMAYNIIILGALNAIADYLGRIWGIFTRGYTLRSMDFNIGDFPGLAIIGPLSVALTSAVLYIFLVKTKLGIALRAAVENEELARSLGIDVDRAYLVAWIIAGVLAGYSGAVLTLYLSVEPDTGWMILANIFAASIAGGLSNIFGAVLGAFFMGFVEVPLATYIASIVAIEPYVVLQYRPLLPLIAVALFLIIIPQGLTSLRRR
ncbi:amino acid/amide ABC transporter membrane protein 1, HAAT family [Pyrobaculum islandicum DSM 4184]|uniref:Amino acid/amide ABC transporter membrane protein 1, HAAT family n=1 Tax=Pyrobaculum islandicum (strain DSM 4184 / JCM 9189 / GEO3) TaxID=384616 RepID=A1RRB3_PYRIL|nr:branched-chain amino acid ABC transporter permease [Pyrobaculum islandicum]ABL87495.1 amino acid/amide ABC transporter membrane protein 1, HAAT family [Pyrobaculum islandicum DSM 4184]